MRFFRKLRFKGKHLIISGVFILLLSVIGLLLIVHPSPPTISEEIAIQLAIEYLKDTGINNPENYPVTAIETSDEWLANFFINPYMRPAGIMVIIKKQDGEITILEGK